MVWSVVKIIKMIIQKNHNKLVCYSARCTNSVQGT